MLTHLDFVRVALDAVTGDGVLQFLVRLTAIAAVGSLMLVLRPRASAAVRHRIAIATLASCLVLPLAGLLLPARPLPLLPARLAANPAPALALLQVPVEGGENERRTFERRATPSDRPDAGVSSERSGVPAALDRTHTEPRATGPAARRAWNRASAGSVGSAWGSLPAPAQAPSPIAVVALMSWLVSLALLVRMMVSLRAAGRLSAGAEPVADERVLHTFARAREALGVGRPVALRQTPRVTVPVVCGIARPTLIVPPGAGDWSPERLTSVLVHELAHVARNDGLALVITRLASAAFWFHPLIGSLARHAWLACEQACDDVVLAHGARPSSYAEDLLVIARNARAQDERHGLAPAFVRRSALERRLASILETGVRRGPASRWTTVGIGAAALLMLVVLGPVRLVSAGASSPAALGVERSAAGDATSPGDAVESTGSGESPSETVTERPNGITIELAANRSGEEWFDRGKDRYNSRNYASSAAAYLHAAEAGYRTGTAYYNAACSFALDDQTESALDALEAALKAGFDQPELVASDDDLNSLRSSARFQRLQARARNTDRAVAQKNGAVSEYETLRSRHSTDASAWREVGVTLMRSGETTRAVDAFATQFTIDSSAASVYNMACAMSLGGRRSAALDVLERAILLGSGNADHMRKDEDLRGVRGDPEFARLLELARDLDLQFPPGGGRGQWRRSLPRYERVTRDHPEAGRAWFNLGYAQLASGDAKGCVDSNRRALALGYRVPTTMYNIACGYAQMDRPDDAIRWLERAEAAGLEVGRMALSDDDLDPLHFDPRFQRMRDRWRRQQSIDKIEKAREKDKNKDDDEN